MKKFKFSLQSILDLKKQLLEGLKIEIINLNSKHMKLEEDIHDLNNILTDVKKEVNEEMSKAMTIQEITYSKIRIKSILNQIDKKEKEKMYVKQQQEEKKQELIEKNTEISGLDKLREKELNEYNEQVAKAEELFMEEFVSNKKVSGEYAF